MTRTNVLAFTVAAAAATFAAVWLVRRHKNKRLQAAHATGRVDAQ